MAERVFDTSGLRDRDKQFLDRRRVIWETGFRPAYVAVNVDDVPVYLSWFIGHDHAELARSYWGPLFPEIVPELMIGEGAWVPPDYRKRGVMREGMYVCTEAAKADFAPGVRYVVAYAEHTNSGAVVGTHYAGFDVVSRRTETWRMGRRSVSFEPATEGDFSVFDDIDLTS